MPDLYRDPFGRLLVPPETLPRTERVMCLRRLTGELQAARSIEAQWLGRTLLAWLHDGGDLEQLLGVRPPRGSHARVEHLTRRTARNALLLKLASIVGGDARAARVLQGLEPAPVKAAKLVEELHMMRAPCSVHAFTRARTASRHGR